MKQKFIQYITEHDLFAPGEHLVVGVSGGADSVCLLKLLHEIRREWRLTLSVVHINHGIRSQEAEADACYVRELAEQWELPFFLIKRDVPALARERGQTEEEAGRELRYRELENIRRQQYADWIAVAHHQEDQAETVLFQALRGSGIRGLAGMAPKTGYVLRPLLDVTRGEIESYLQREHISYRNDSTNEDTAYTRNYIRKELFPLLEQRLNRQAVRHLAEMAGDAGQWRDYVERQAAPVAGRIIRQGENGRLVLDLHELLRQEAVIQDEIIRIFLRQKIRGAKDITRTHYRQIRELFSKDTGKRLHLPDRVVIERRYNELYLYRDGGGERTDFSLVCAVPSVNIVEMDGGSSSFTLTLKERDDLPQQIPQKDYTKWFDYDKILNGLVLRTPKEGDYFIMDKAGHRKKLNRYYIDRKIPLRERERQLVLAEGNKVLWAIPGRMSEDCKVTESTKHILVVTRERIHHERRNQGID